METALLELTQFGAAGLIGLLWIVERRHAGARERQLSEAHERLLATHREVDVLLDVVRDNTRALARLEQAQQRLVEVADRLLPGRGPTRPAA